MLSFHLMLIKKIALPLMQFKVRSSKKV